MKSTHLIINNATITFINHLTNFFHFSHSHAAITLNQVTTVIIIARKKANALIAESTKKNTFQMRELVNHSNQPIASESPVAGVKPLHEKLNTSQNNQFDP